MTDLAERNAAAIRTDLPAKLGRVAAGLIALVIVVLSVVPPSLRPVTASHMIEHLAIFAALGAAFGLATPGRPRLQVIAVLVFATTVELMQIGAPGRHARLVDFAVDASGALVGLALAAVAQVMMRRITGPAAHPSD
ncbi:MAG: VanZ family protein [Rhodoplanes sp.]|uniref:VanZ family protein n=1 Tax=Rhodoplanes sp. TaxID=1968906 RepID=UPI0017C3C6DF|nr:VanZ family protein [Rhodoplanes sp.]NVO17290.1 VanZ family protein [Rhodoplanes sp.]